MQGTQDNTITEGTGLDTTGTQEIPTLELPTLELPTLVSPSPALVAARAQAAAEAAKDEIQSTKRCDTCGEVKVATPEFFPRNKRRKDGLASRCHICNRQITSEWAKDNRSKHNRNQQRRYWAKRKQGLVRTPRVIGGVVRTSWAPKPTPAPDTVAA